MSNIITFNDIQKGDIVYKLKTTEENDMTISYEVGVFKTLNVKNTTEKLEITLKLLKGYGFSPNMFLLVKNKTLSVLSMPTKFSMYGHSSTIDYFIGEKELMAKIRKVISQNKQTLDDILSTLKGENKLTTKSYYINRFSQMFKDNMSNIKISNYG